jgi:hypothetical protein
MGLVEKDYIVRLLEQLSQMVAAISAHMTGGRPHEALESIESARRALAGPLASALERVDASSVVALIGADKARVYAELARLESQARAAFGEDGMARAAARRADEIDRCL